MMESQQAVLETPTVYISPRKLAKTSKSIMTMHPLMTMATVVAASVQCEN